MRYLLDTNFLSELRRAHRANRGVLAWSSANDPAQCGIGVVTLGEIRQGIEAKRRKDPGQARHLEAWFDGVVRDYADRFLEVTMEIANRWGRLAAATQISDADGLIAATALEHDLTLVTRNVGDFAGTGVRILNPWK